MDIKYRLAFFIICFFPAWSALLANAVAPGQPVVLPKPAARTDMVDAPLDEVWFHRLGSPAPWPAETMKQAVELVYSDLRGDGPADPSSWSFLPDDDEPRIVFISWSDGEHRAVSVAGRGQGWSQALLDAIRKTRRKLAEPEKLECLMIDLVQHVVLFPRWRSDQDQIPDPGLRGVALTPAAPFAFLPGQIVFNRFYTAAGQLDMNKLSELLVEQVDFERLGQFKLLAAYKGAQPLFSFDTQSVFFDGVESRLVYRGHCLRQSLTSRELRQSADRLVDFLLREFREDGSLPTDDGRWTTHAEHGQHALSSLVITLRGLTGYVALSGDSEVLSAAERLAALLSAYIESVAVDAEIPALVEYIVADLSTNAHAIIAWLELAELTGREAYLRTAVALSRFIRWQWQPTGAVLARRMVSSETLDAETSVNASAVALLALVRLYEATGDSFYIRMAEQGMEYLLQQSLKPYEMVDLPSAPWLVAAGNALYTYNRDPELVRQVERLVLSMTSLQRVEDVPLADLAGSYLDRATTTQVAALTSPLTAAVRLFLDTGKEASAENLLETLHLNMIFQLQAQLGPASVMFLSEPDDLAGGFRDDIRGMVISLEGQSRQLLSLVSVLNLMAERELAVLPLGPDRRQRLTRARELYYRFGRGLPPEFLEADRFLE